MLSTKLFFLSTVPFSYLLCSTGHCKPAGCEPEAKRIGVEES